MTPPLKNPGEILHAALQKEQSAHDFYAKLAIHCHVDFVRELLLHLQNEEAKHIDLIKQMLARLK